MRGTLFAAAAVAAAGVAAFALLGRWAWATGFGVGALVSLGNFHLIVRAVAGLVPAPGASVVGGVWKGALFRLGIVGAVLAVALAVFHVSLPALAAGLLITQVTMIVLWLSRALRSLT